VQVIGVGLWIILAGFVFGILGWKRMANAEETFAVIPEVIEVPQVSERYLRIRRARKKPRAERELEQFV
jgi:hypothetical protein